MKLHIQNVKKTYDDKEVLKGGSAVFEQGKIYGLLEMCIRDRLRQEYVAETQHLWQSLN